MGKGNAAVKQWLSVPERFADMFNGTVFEGKTVVLPEDLEPIESETDILVTDKLENTKEVQRHRDIVMRWKQGVNLAILGCENQAKIHYAMPVRNMMYDGLNYTGQIQQIKKQNQKESKNEMTSAEFLSGFRKNDKIYPVITIVFYYGTDAWDASTTLYEMFPEGILENEMKVLKKYIPNYWINLVEAGNIEKCELFQSDLQEIFGMLKCRNSERDLVNYMKENEHYFRNVDEDTYHVIREFLHSERILKKEVSRRNGEERIDMCKALEDLYNHGIELGIEQGEQKKLLNLIKTKLAKGKSAEEIADALEESVDTIKQLINSL